VIQPLAEIGALCRANGTFLHTDAAQAVGKMPVDVNALNVDLLSISGHKLYGPKGVGALYTRRRPRVRLEPLLNGGGQERGLRSGTVPTAAVVGLGRACEIASQVRAGGSRTLRAGTCFAPAARLCLPLTRPSPFGPHPSGDGGGHGSHQPPGGAPARGHHITLRQRGTERPA